MSLDEAVFLERVELYKDYIDIMISLIQEGTMSKPKAKTIQKKLTLLNMKIFLVGSPELIRAFNKSREKMEKPIDPMDSFTALGELFLQMRKDIFLDDAEDSATIEDYTSMMLKDR